MPNSAGAAGSAFLKLAGVLLCAFTLPASASTAPGAQPTAASIAESVARLKPGEFLWAPQVAPEGPLIIVVSLKRQRAYVYRNGVMIGVTTVSTGTEGHETPTGIFTILQKEVDHKSNLYDDAPMPFMQRLTWDGVAMHAGKLPGYPASHGCIRLPVDFAKLLYGVTSKGMTVIITDDAPIPRVAPSPLMLQATPQNVAAGALGPGLWRPELAPQGPVSVIISAADSRLVVLRNGVEIGSSPVRIEGGVSAPGAFVLRAIDVAGRHWLALPLPWKSGASDEKVTAADRDRISIPDDFRKGLVAILEPGATVVVTPDTLQSGSTGMPVTVLSDGN